MVDFGAWMAMDRPSGGTHGPLWNPHPRYHVGLFLFISHITGTYGHTSNPSCLRVSFRHAGGARHHARSAGSRSRQAGRCRAVFFRCAHRARPRDGRQALHAAGHRAGRHPRQDRLRGARQDQVRHRPCAVCRRPRPVSGDVLPPGHVLPRAGAHARGGERRRARGRLRRVVLRHARRQPRTQAAQWQQKWQRFLRLPLPGKPPGRSEEARLEEE